MSDFASLGIRAEIIQALDEQRIAQPTPIQEKTIPVVLSGQDVIAQAQTGTGKTLAFLLPILETVNSGAPHVQALVITPTRELAIQITNEATKITKHHSDVHILAVYGGQDVQRQINKLQRGAQIVVGTPGRLLDHARRRTIDLSGASMVVLDEADQMLQLGFLEEVEDILRQTPSSRQTMLFSATMPAQIRSLARRYMRDPTDIRIKTKSVAVAAVRQLVVETTDRTKQDTLRRLIDAYRPYLAIAFCRTKRRAKTLCEALQAHGYAADELHGDLSQSGREQVIKKLRSAQIQILVATDVAARGLDVEGITHVFNYDIPHDVESYIHRIGRTGRAGEKGLAVTLVAPKDRVYLAMIEKGIHQSIDKDETHGARPRVQRDESRRSGETTAPGRPRQRSSRAAQGNKASTFGNKRRGRSSRAGSKNKRGR